MAEGGENTPKDPSVVRAQSRTDLTIGELRQHLKGNIRLNRQLYQAGEYDQGFYMLNRRQLVRDLKDLRKYPDDMKYGEVLRLKQEEKREGK